ncbi:hypothetical protein CANARDRAFT_24662 [[Candida] arabinofermentans NRRL YB-2248]|uniref:PHD-type domain-containing protein n=1 Tax=[Candida] arabinofermentans NRRL YB-2248 TaxID=983967 RepID=A0A1E4SW01_9ASCO|nr:hypothetical protein CANARDRAFT_24662 [[Candida] arabinofermentans NRRL YB-2248]
MDSKKLSQLQEKYNKFAKAPKYDLNSEELFCVCRRIDDGELMVACDGCDEWFHFKCMKLNDKYKNLVNNYYCIFCDDLFNKGHTLWKKKCRLPQCYEPIQINKDPAVLPSKYCSEDHGIEFMKQEVIRRFKNSHKEAGMKESQLVTIITGSENLNQFKSLGSELPQFDKQICELPDDVKILLSEIQRKLEKQESQEKLYRSKEQYLMKLREQIKLFNDAFTAIEEKLAGPVQTTKSKKPKKSSKLKVDICGFDQLLKLNDSEWIEFNETENFKRKIDFTTLEDLGINQEEFERAYMALKHADDDDNENDDEDDQMVDVQKDIFKDFCMKDKKKCVKHLTWFSIIQDNVRLKLNEAEIKIAEMKEKKEKLMKDVNIRNWENWENGYS